MQKLVIEESKYTPEILLDPQENRIVIQGKSCPENSFEFYAPVIAWMKEYFPQENQSTTIDLHMPFCSSSSSKVLFDMFDLFEAAQEKGHKIIINWMFESEDEFTRESGEEFQEDFKILEINLIELKDS